LRRMCKAGELKQAGDPDHGGGYKLVHKHGDIYTQVARTLLTPPSPPPDMIPNPSGKTLAEMLREPKKK